MKIDALDVTGDLIEQLAFWQGIRDRYRECRTMTGLWLYITAIERLAELRAEMTSEPETAA